MHTLLMTLLAVTLPPSEEVERILASPHGIDATLAARAKADCLDPDGWKMVDGWADPDLLHPSKSPLEIYKATNAFVVLTRMCGPKGMDAAVVKLQAVRKARDTSWASLQALVDPKNPKPNPAAKDLLGFVEQLYTIERQGLQMFGAAGSNALVKDLLPRVQTDTPLQLAMVTYFSATAPGDPAVKQELTALRAKTKSKELVAAIDAWLKLVP
ncbi:MAG: hypothetical protein ACOZQL_25410 [Myxococcota bacterium]